MVEIKLVQDLLEHNQTDDLLKRQEDLLKEFEVVLEQEEMLWYQKSREKWVVLGDRNTSFFHTSTIIRRKRNRIDMLKNEEGSWITNATELENLANEYYKRLYSMADVEPVVDTLPRDGFLRLDQSEMMGLNKVFTPAEVVMAVKSMGTRCEGKRGEKVGCFCSLI